MNQLRPNNLIIGDSIVNGLWRYQQISSSFLHQTSNLGIGGDRVEHVLWRMENLDIPTSVENAILQCGTNSLGKNSPNDIANSIICIALTAIKRKPSINVIIMGILPRNERNSVNRMLIKKVNNLICQYCTKVKNEVNIFFITPSQDWILSTGELNPSYFWIDGIHLTKTGNLKFAKSITNYLATLKHHVQPKISPLVFPAPSNKIPIFDTNHFPHLPPPIVPFNSSQISKRSALSFPKPSKQFSRTSISKHSKRSLSQSSPSLQSQLTSPSLPIPLQTLLPPHQISIPPPLPPSSQPSLPLPY